MSLTRQHPVIKHISKMPHQRQCSSPKPVSQIRIKPWCQRTSDCWLPVDYISWLLTLTFVLTFNQKLKFPKGSILLSFSRRFQFWTLFLHLKLQNWLIGTFFIVVSSKAFFKASLSDLRMLIQSQTFFNASLSDLLMLIQSQTFIKLPPWVWGRVLEIY